MDVFAFTEWLRQLIEAAPTPDVHEVKAVDWRGIKAPAIQVTVAGPGNPSIDKVFLIRVTDA